MKIVGNTVGMGLPKANLMQTNPEKGDFVNGKEEFLKQFGSAVSPVKKTSDMVQSVGVDEEGKLWTRLVSGCLHYADIAASGASEVNISLSAISLVDSNYVVTFGDKLITNDGYLYEVVELFIGSETSYTASLVCALGGCTYDCVIAISNGNRPPNAGENVTYAVVSGSLMAAWEKVHSGKKPYILLQYIGEYEDDVFNYFSEAVHVNHVGYHDGTPECLIMDFIMDDELVRLVSDSNADITNNVITSRTIAGLPTKISELENDSGYMTEEDVSEAVESEKGNIVDLIIAELQGLPVFGVVDEDNVIKVTSQLSDGVYVLTYENTDGTYSEIATFTIGSSEPEGPVAVTIVWQHGKKATYQPAGDPYSLSDQDNYSTSEIIPVEANMTYRVTMGTYSYSSSLTDVLSFRAVYCDSSNNIISNEAISITKGQTTTLTVPANCQGFALRLYCGEIANADLCAFVTLTKE